MKANYCSRCASALALARLGEKEREVCPACGYIAYRNPAPVSLVLVENNNSLLMIRRALPPLQGYWAPPGGYVECGESLEDAAAREVREETSLDVRIEGLEGVFSHREVDVVIVCYRASLRQGVAGAGDDATEVGWFRRGELPKDPVPAADTYLDKWFFDVIHQATAAWR